MFFPEIEAAYQQEHARQSRYTKGLLICISALLVMMFFLLAFLYKRQQILDSMRAKLQESYQIKIAKLENLDKKRINIQQLIDTTENLILHEERQFFQQATDDELNRILLELRRELQLSAHSLIRAQQDIINYLNQIYKKYCRFPGKFMHTSVWSRHAKEIYVYISLVCHAKEICAYISLVCYAKDLCQK